MERIERPKVNQPSYGENQVAMCGAPIAVEVRNDTIFFQVSNNMLDKNTSFVDDMVVEFLKQG